MQDDPTVKDVLNAAADLPKKVGKTVLKAKIPVGAVKRAFQFLLSHWISLAFSVAILLWTSSHYLSEMQRARYVCYGPKADFSLPSRPRADIAISSALAISPISQFIASVTFADGSADPDFDFKKFLSENDPNLIYAPSLSRAQNNRDATNLLKYGKSQMAAACIADKSWLTAAVVLGHALIAYLLLLVFGHLRRQMSEAVFGS
jgi:hypothetical protein